MSNCAIVGINWGDEGKGRMVDLIAREYDIVCRYQGGNNAGHTIVNEYGAIFVHNGVTGVVAALIAADDVVFSGDQVDHTTLALVAPVDTHNCAVAHVR